MVARHEDGGIAGHDLLENVEFTDDLRRHALLLTQHALDFRQYDSPSTSS